MFYLDDCFCDAETFGWVSAATAHYVDEDAMDWTLPEEAFPLRSAPPQPAPAHTPPAPDGDVAGITIFT